MVSSGLSQIGFETSHFHIAQKACVTIWGCGDGQGEYNEKLLLHNGKCRLQHLWSPHLY